MANIYYKEKNDLTEILEREFKDDDNSVFVVGGDGTYLRALKDFPLNKVTKIYAFNTGTLGILLPLSPAGIEETISKIKSGNCRSITRRRLYIKSHDYLIANEIAILSRVCRLNTFRVYIDGELIEIKGDCLIVSGQIGSSGHNFSANGPISLADVIIINCIAPYRCNFRPIIVPIHTKLRIEAQGCYGSADTSELEGDVFEIEMGDLYTVIVDDNYSPISFISKQFYNLK